MNPVFVLHDAVEDRLVIEKVRAAGHHLPVIEHDNPQVLKAVLGQASLVLGSRFHALVSSLSQGIPCIGAGWSHKYPELFADFNCRDLLIADLSDKNVLREAIGQLASPEGHIHVTERITAAAAPIMAANQCMWREVEGIIQSVRS
jgi:colanic acid/amylovoran biosynthesis protein